MGAGKNDFIEVDLIMILFNRLENLPVINKKSSDSDIREVCQLMYYLETNFIKSHSYVYASKPIWVNNSPTVKQIQAE